MKLDIRLIIILFLIGIAASACGTVPPALRDEINTTKEELGRIRKVAITSSAGHVEVSGGSKSANFILGLSALLLMPVPGIIAGTVVGQSAFSHREGEANQLLPPSWGEQEMTSAFVRAASENRLFEVISPEPASRSEMAPSNATIHLNLEKIDLIIGTATSTSRETGTETMTLFVTGTARLNSPANALLWQTTETARGSDLSPNDIKDTSLIRGECQKLIENLARKFARNLAYARQ